MLNCLLQHCSPQKEELVLELAYVMESILYIFYALRVYSSRKIEYNFKS